jgi:hypothetical protein
LNWKWNYPARRYKKSGHSMAQPENLIRFSNWKKIGFLAGEAGSE